MDGAENEGSAPLPAGRGTAPRREWRCPACGVHGYLDAGKSPAFCPRCGARVAIGDVTISVEGRHANEVERVTRRLAKDESDRAAQRAAAQLRRPWVTGSFYLFAFLAIVVVLLVISTSLPAWALPIILVGGFVGVVTIAALQLRQDDRLSEENLVTLLTLVFKKLPVVAGRRNDSAG